MMFSLSGARRFYLLNSCLSKPGGTWRWCLWSCLSASIYFSLISVKLNFAFDFRLYRLMCWNMRRLICFSAGTLKKFSLCLSDDSCRPALIILIARISFSIIFRLLPFLLSQMNDGRMRIVQYLEHKFLPDLWSWPNLALKDCLFFWDSSN